MFTILVSNNEGEIVELLSKALQLQGYSLVDEEESAGLVKIIKKSVVQENSLLGRKISELSKIMLKSKTGKLYRWMLNEIEKPLIEAVLEYTEGNQLKAARIVKIGTATYFWIDQLAD
jgi:DNA-binding protein Fis